MNRYIETRGRENPPARKAPAVCPQPEPSERVKNPCLSLNSDRGIDWRFSMESHREEAVVKNDYDFSGWSRVTVPGNVLMQGFDILNDTQYFYKTRVRVPEEYGGNRIVLRFHGVYSVAKVWVNGAFIRSHIGGFTTWDCDVTESVKAGEEAVITVAFTDVLNDVSIASRYAHYNIGGINRAVELLCVPFDHIAALHYETRFDDKYRNATLKLMLETRLSSAQTAEIRLSLRDDRGNEVLGEKNTLLVSADTPRFAAELPVENPKHWDSEHPCLYELTATLSVGRVETERVAVPVGFREITFGGQKGTDLNKIYVNGQPVKLRGACHHDVHPELGRTTTPELDETDVIAAKRANMNYIRTSHYPPSKEFLSLCDRYGIYVEEENAVCFQFTHAAPENYQKNSGEWYVGQLVEMVERDRSHPCVLIWSLGNESLWHGDFKEEYEYIKGTDLGRPVKFSYPDMEPLDSAPPLYDIFSKHYAAFDGEMSLSEKPTLHDEYVHVACYNHEEIARDTNVRNFWGESLYRAWENIVKRDGALGGAVWAGIDDLFHIPEHTHERHQLHSKGRATGYGEWGACTDIWRREKPEFWLTKKAYSPVRIKDGPLPPQTRNTPIRIPVSNWFNHTNLNEVEFHWSIGRASGVTEGIDLAPYEDGTLVIPCSDWDRDSVLTLACYLKSDRAHAIDSYKLSLRESEPVLEPPAAVGVFESFEEGGLIRFTNGGLSAAFDRASGMLTGASLEGRALLAGGPHILLEGAELGEWRPREKGFSYAVAPGKATVTVEGDYGDLPVRYTFELYGDGTIDVSFSSERAPSALSRVGLSFDLPPEADRVSWNRRGFYADYPENHIGRMSGSAVRRRNGSLERPDRYRSRPEWDWKDDMRNFYLFPEESPEDGAVTNDFNALRENIYDFTVFFEESERTVSVLSAADDGAKIDVGREAPGARLVVLKHWTYPSLAWGNYQKQPVSLPSNDARTVRLKLK